MARRKSADTVHLRLRFPEKLRRRIEAAATKNQQSMNAEIVERLERSFGQEDFIATVEKTAEATAVAAADRLIKKLVEGDVDPNSRINTAMEKIQEIIMEDMAADAAKEDWEEQERERGTE
jgi:hypothetical protein